MLAKINVPANSEVRLVTATIGETRGDGKGGWDSDSCASFRMSYKQAGMTASKKAPAGMSTVEVSEGTSLTVDEFGTVEVVDQSGTTTKPMEMGSVGYVPGLSRNLLPTFKSVEKWGKPLVYYKTKAVLGFPREGSLVFNFCPPKGLFCATGVRQPPSQEAALRLVANTAESMKIEATGQ